MLPELIAVELGHCEQAKNEAAMTGPHPSLQAGIDNGALIVDLDSILLTPPVVAQTTLQVLWAVSAEPN